MILEAPYPNRALASWTSPSISPPALRDPAERVKTYAEAVERLNDCEVARLMKRAAQAAGLRGDVPEKKRLALFSGHSLRAGLAGKAEVNERHAEAAGP